MNTLTPKMQNAISALADEIALSNAPAVYNHEVLVTLKNSLRNKQEVHLRQHRATIALDWSLSAKDQLTPFRKPAHGPFADPLHKEYGGKN